ncbi:uncharacterized protein LOC107698895 [Sinocyclocheilus anshuiensis]|uniref:uncharacterized protein LOC107698895 n=1 Tax=Sinocyclocheilus anshuiensis TaxID=1608454 RepID=UPI0007B9734C|nr:PREDICTED: uncharacterized protein LOC107698895 [Sinocyclocheilus anshuiensis]
MFRVLLLLLAVAGLHARPLHRFPNGKLKQIGPQMVQDEHRDSSVLKHMNTDVKPKKQLPVPAEFCRQGTEPSRRFLMDLNTGMLKRGVGEMNRRVSGLDEFRQGTENKLHTLQELRMRPMMRSQYSAQSEKHEQRAIPAEVYRKCTETSRNVLMDQNTGLLKEHRNEMDRRVGGSAKWEVVSEHEDTRSQDSSEHKENHKAVPVEIRRQGTEPSRRILIDTNTGMPKEELSEMNRRVSGFYNPAPIEKRQGTEPSRRFLMDMDTGMLKHEVGEMNRRVSGFYNPPAYEMRKGTQNSHATLVDSRTGQLLPALTELQRSTEPLDEFRQGTENKLHTLQELRMRPMMRSQYSAQSEKHEQRAIPAEVYRKGTETSRNVLMDQNTGLLKEHRNEMDRRVGGSAKWEVVSEHEDIRSQDSSEHKENHKAVPVEIRRQGTEPSRRILIDTNTGMPKEELSEMNRRVSGFYNPAPIEKRQGTEPSSRFLMDMDTGMLKHEVGEMNRRVSGCMSAKPFFFLNINAPLHKQDTEPSRNLLMDLNAGLLKEHRNEMDRRVGGSAKWEVVSEHEDIRSQDSSEHKENHKAVPVEIRRQGTEPSRRILIDTNTGMPKEELSEMNRRVSGCSLRKSKKDTNFCLTQLEQMQRKCNDVRSRRNNVRLVNLPTGMEGDDPVGFLQKMLPKWIPDLSCPIEIDRAHRVYSNSNSPRPRSLIFRLLRCPDRQAILQGARKAKPTLPGGARLEFYADYTLLKVTYKGQKYSFESLEDAEKYLEGLDGAATPIARRSLNFLPEETMEDD